jgi:hypothetical protein
MSLSRTDLSAIDSAAAAVVRHLVTTLDREYPPGTVMRRDAHPKHHALVRAELVVDQSLAADLRHGVFAQPRRFPAWMRFSNGAPRVQPDTRRDQRGMAIKVLDVPGPKVLSDERDAVTQDFLLASAPRFFIRTPEDYAALAAAASRKPAFRKFGFFFGPNPLRWRVHELRALFGSLQHTHHLLAIRYWSQVPFRLGPHVVKYAARPVTPIADDGRSNDPNFLRARLVAHLAVHPARFELLVQRQRDAAMMPIDDATVEWDERQAPFERVATIEIPRQACDSAEQMALAEHLSFNPWHTLQAHEPLGAINRMRRLVYEAIAAHRHAHNGIVRREPTSLTIEPDFVTPRRQVP